MLENVPKVLILQCCQSTGECSDVGSESLHPQTDANTTEPLLSTKSPPPPDSFEIPAGDSSTAIISSTLQGQVSLRGFFTQALFNTADQPNHPSDIMEIFRAVCRRMERKQIPVVHSTMSKIFALNSSISAGPTYFERFKNFFGLNR
ncbi:hypothetical protein EB796_002480 [Bugula neritina]|uniref:Peptidase C14 caspase domain-containing protein n=1 Tax=Bugula neritina TaxID=10212 RepID=A0A7J7KM24_BUGNE|nr:hypothetical protein EB796_002480 [Bugula neritina]